MDQGVANEGFQNDLGDGESKNIHLSLELKFSTSKTCDIENDGEDKKHYSKPLSYLNLFRYANASERRLIVIGICFAVGAGVCFPFFLMLYCEFMSLLVDRNMENVTSSFSPIHSMYGGGRRLTNGTYDERMTAMLEDSVAFAIGGITISLSEFVLCVLAVTFMNRAAINQVSRVRMLFLRALLRQEMAWHDTHGTANVASRLTDDLEKMQDGIGEALAVVIYLVVCFISAIIVAFVEAWKLSLSIFWSVPIIIAAQVILAKLQGSLAVKESESYLDANAVVEEVIGAIGTVAAFGGEKEETDRYTSKLKIPSEIGRRRGLYLGLGTGTTWLVVFVARAITFWYGVILILGDRYLDADHRQYTPGIILVVLFGILTGALNIGLAASQFSALNIARGAARAVFEIIERSSQIDCFCPSGQLKKEIVGDIEFSGVYFQYPARPNSPVLRCLDLKISHGQTVAIVGQSGCGKTTVMQLIQRLYDPTQGKVILDGVDVRHLNVSCLRSQIGVVCQEPVLFNTTIEENIRYGAPNATHDEIRQAAVEANADEFVRNLPQGYQTVVGERGAQLSGGQKQRIAIARALVRRPAILLLDEATSALDRASEAQVQAALEAASKGRTTLIVAHRLSTVRAADRIVVLSEGRIVEQGTHDELMAAKGHYFELVSADVSNTDNSSSTIFQNIDLNSEVPILSNWPDCASSIKPTPTDQAVEYPASFGRILALSTPEWLYLFLGCIAAILVGACIPAHVYLIGSVYRALSFGDPADVKYTSNIYCAFFVAVGFFTFLGTFLQSYAFGVAGVRLTTRLRVSAFAALMRQEVGWFDEEQNNVGALSARLAGDAPIVEGVTRTYFGTYLQTATTLIIGIAISLCLSWKLTLVCIAAVPITLSSVILEHKIIKKHAIAANRALEEATRVGVEAVSQLRTIAGLGAEAIVLQSYQQELDRALAACRRKMRFRGLVFGVESSLSFMCYSLCFWYGGTLIVNEKMPYENVIIVGDALIYGVWILGQSLAHAPNFTAAKLAAGRLFQILDREPQIKGPSDCVNPESMLGDIAYSRVEFSYPSRPEVEILRGLDLAVRPGQTVALVGASGCGKSTCIKLLQRFYDPNSGQIAIGHQPINGIPLRKLRREMGIVSQEPVLFDRTIAENIAYGDNERTPGINEIISVAMLANIHSFVASLPLGYNTRLGAKGMQLSGGQKQRIAIARALLRNPRLLLLDEATSALDSQSEKVVQAALEQAREGRTCIIIAHRLSTIQNADLICVLDRGTLAETGTHSELLQRGGIYRNLHQQGNKP